MMQKIFLNKKLQMAELNIPVLDAEEQRVLGALMEKSKTTPDYYPMTINALMLACNQKSSRKPVVNYDDETIVLTLDRLRKKGLVSTATGGSSRSVKYKHNFAIVFPVLPREVAAICLLLLRGPLTPGEINSNSGRLYEFESLDEVQQVLEKLQSEELPLIKQLPKRSGQKEVRFVHLLGDVVFEEEQADDVITVKSEGLAERVTILENELSKLRADFDKLMKELNG